MLSVQALKHVISLRCESGEVYSLIAGVGPEGVLVRAGVNWDLDVVRDEVTREKLLPLDGCTDAAVNQAQNELHREVEQAAIGLGKVVLDAAPTH